MFAFRLGVVVAFAIMTQQSAISPPKIQNLSSLSVHVDVLCPYNVICREGEPRLTVPGSDRTGCCTDCSCADDCGLTERCCFPQQDRFNSVDRSHQKCLYSSTVAAFEQAIAYNMIVDGYPNATGEECASCGDDVTASALGAMYPVFSSRTGRIYKNMKCARCHGLSDKDVIVWEAYLACNVLKSMDASTFFQFFEDGKMTPTCSIKFSYPGLHSDLRSEECIPVPLFYTCSAVEDFELPDDLNMTHSDVVERCNSDFTSPVYNFQWYKNVFCRLCDGNNFLRYEPLFTCDKLDAINDDERLFESSFVALLIPETSRTVTAASKPNSSVLVRRACSQHEVDDCRLAYCPSGKVPDGQAQCHYISGHWKTKHVGVNIKLIPIRPLTMAAVRTTDFRTVLTNKSLSVSPWDRNWRIERLMSTFDKDANNDSFVEHFVVRLFYTRYNIDIDRVIADIKTVMKRDWLLSIDGVLLSHRQEFSELTNFECEDQNGPYCFPDFTYYQLISDSPSFIKDISVPEFKTLYEAYHLLISFGITITQMFFCDQVALAPEEYQLDIRFRILRHNATGRIFYPGEIAIAFDEGLVPKLCVQDVGFYVVSPQSAGVRLAMTHTEWILLLQIFLVSGLINP